MALSNGFSRPHLIIKNNRKITVTVSLKHLSPVLYFPKSFTNHKPLKTAAISSGHTCSILITNLKSNPYCN